MPSRYRCLVLPLVLGGLLAAPLRGQNPADTSVANAIQLLRSDVRADKATIIGRALALSDSQSAVFWPLYREYEAETAKLNDERVQLIRDYIAAYDTLTDKHAHSLMERALDLDQRRAKLAKNQYGKFSKKLPAKTVAHFFQLNNFLNRVVELQVLAALPEIR